MSARERVAGLIVARGRLVIATIRMIEEIRAHDRAIGTLNLGQMEEDEWCECAAQLEAQDEALADAVTGIRALLSEVAS